MPKDGEGVQEAGAEEAVELVAGQKRELEEELDEFGEDFQGLIRRLTALNIPISLTDTGGLDCPEKIDLLAVRIYETKKAQEEELSKVNEQLIDIESARNQCQARLDQISTSLIEYSGPVLASAGSLTVVYFTWEPIAKMLLDAGFIVECSGALSLTGIGLLGVSILVIGGVAYFGTQALMNLIMQKSLQEVRVDEQKLLLLKTEFDEVEIRLSILKRMQEGLIRQENDLKSAISHLKSLALTIRDSRDKMLPSVEAFRDLLQKYRIQHKKLSMPEALSKRIPVELWSDSSYDASINFECVCPITFEALEPGKAVIRNEQVFFDEMILREWMEFCGAERYHPCALKIMPDKPAEIVSLSLSESSKNASKEDPRLARMMDVALKKDGIKEKIRQLLSTKSHVLSASGASLFPAKPKPPAEPAEPAELVEQIISKL